MSGSSSSSSSASGSGAAAASATSTVVVDRLALLRKLDIGIKSHYADLLRSARIPGIQSVSDVGIAVEGGKIAVACEQLLSSVESLMALVREVKQETLLAALEADSAEKSARRGGGEGDDDDD